MNEDKAIVEKILSNAKIEMLSGIGKWKNEKEMWSQYKDCGVKNFTIQMLKNGCIIVRGYTYYGNIIAYEKYNKNYEPYGTAYRYCEYEKEKKIKFKIIYDENYYTNYNRSVITYNRNGKKIKLTKYENGEIVGETGYCMD